MIYPKPIKKGDTIAVISPSSEVKPEYVGGASAVLEELGYVVRVMPSALGPADGSYASSQERRLADFREAWHDPRVRVVLCARGGYGAVHLLQHITYGELLADPKWLVGFSDISALHARINAAGIVSLHAPMAKHLARLGAHDPCTYSMFKILSDEKPCMDYTLMPHPYNIPGCGEGALRGGNLAVLSHLLSEDVSEAIYATERMLWQLSLSGALRRYKGILVGSFTETRADKNFPDTAAMIRARLSDWGVDGVPVAFGVPVGHTDHNIPLIEGASVRLEVSTDSVHIYSI